MTKLNLKSKRKTVKLPTSISKNVTRKNILPYYIRKIKNISKNSKSSKKRLPTIMEVDTDHKSRQFKNISKNSKKRLSTIMEVDPEYIPVEMEVDPEYKPGELNLDFNFKGIIVSFVIMGHGGVKNETPIERFKKPDYVRKTNLLGMRYSGINNLVNRQYEENIDEQLSLHKNKIKNELIHFLDQQFLEFLPFHRPIQNRIKEIEKKLNIKNNFFGIKENYSERNAQKYYTGINNEEIIKQSRHSKLKITEPLVKIYSIIRDNRELIPEGESIIIIDTKLKNGITLTEIINIVREYVLNSSYLVELERQGIAKEKLFIMNVVDLTCNYTEKTPLIGFIETNKSQSKTKPSIFTGAPIPPPPPFGLTQKPTTFSFGPPSPPSQKKNPTDEEIEKNIRYRNNSRLSSILPTPPSSQQKNTLNSKI